MCENKFLKEGYAKLDEYIASISDTKGALIAVLHQAQEIFGYLSKDIQLYVARKLKVPSSKVNGVVTFYSYFTETPRGKHVVNVCLGTACYVRGSGDILKSFEAQLGIKAGETTPDGEFTLDALRCVGACGLAPVVIIDGKVSGRLTPDDVGKLLDDKKKEAVKV